MPIIDKIKDIGKKYFEVILQYCDLLDTKCTSMSCFWIVLLAEHEISRTQKNKATESHLGRLKAKLAKLRSELLDPAGGGGGGKGEGFSVARSGDARVAMIG